MTGVLLDKLEATLFLDPLSPQALLGVQKCVTGVLSADNLDPEANLIGVFNLSSEDDFAQSKGSDFCNIVTDFDLIRFVLNFVAESILVKLFDDDERRSAAVVSILAKNFLRKKENR